MKRFFWTVVGLILATAVAAVAYPLVSPYHERLRTEFADPKKREEAVHQAIDFEKNHCRALLGDKMAQYKFAQTLSSGELGFKDTDLAFAWFQRSAKQSYPPAEFAMAHDYFAGDGVRQDNEDGAVWAEKASESGAVPQTRELMGLLFTGGIGEQQDMLKGLDLLKTAQSSEALALAADIDQKFRTIYALPKEQQDAELKKMADAVQADVRSRFPAMEKNLARIALAPAPAETAATK